MTVSLLERNKHLLTSQFFLFPTQFPLCTFVSPFYYLLEHFNIICANSHETEKSSTEPQNIITWISISFEILDEPPCCVRQCRTSFLFILGVLALNFCFISSLHNICLFSGSLFFAHLGSIIFIAIIYLYL